jgi:GTPase
VAAAVLCADACCHLPLPRTTAYGLTGHLPDYACLIVGANMGVVGMCKEHLGVALALKVPAFFVVTKVGLWSWRAVQRHRCHVDIMLSTAPARCRAFDSFRWLLGSPTFSGPLRSQATRGGAAAAALHGPRGAVQAPRLPLTRAAQHPLAQVDICPEHVLKATVSALTSILKRPGVRKKPFLVRSVDDVLLCARNIHTDSLAPIFLTSAVTGGWG